MSNHIVIRTESGTFVGSITLGELNIDMPAALAYTYDSIEHADAVARQLGLTDYMLGTTADMDF